MLPNWGVRLIADRETTRCTQPVLATERHHRARRAVSAPDSDPPVQVGHRDTVVRDEETKDDAREDDQLASWVSAIG